jgi:hypothetical protein
MQLPTTLFTFRMGLSLCYSLDVPLGMELYDE